ncbi:mast cell protease 1A-like [Larimichthys crocea]|uniref:mast cell protease 1A-like n=1 Tax=Larimichthys crocea TaxID=215358 RepID=UPI000F5FC610|nr:mast cell protease 1A-like [Larimichthys crocea]
MHALHKLLLFHLLTSLGRDALGGKVINGKKAQENSMQYMVSLQNSRGEHECGGFLISEDFVLTAAHCDVCKVVLGTHNLKARGIERSIAKWCKHKSYTHYRQGNDIMLLKLSQKVQLATRVQNNSTSHFWNDIRDNEMPSSWMGKDKTNGPTVDELRVVDVSTINKQVCRRQWVVFLTLSSVLVDITQPKELSGDSVVLWCYKGKAVGIVSFGEDNCTQAVPMSTQTFKYLPGSATFSSKRIVKCNNLTPSFASAYLHYIEEG